MATILYTQEELDQFVTRASCCASNQAYKALRAAQVKGKNSCEQNKHNYLEMAICALDDYIPIGTVISEGVSPHAATYACASIDLSGLMTESTFLGVTFTVNGDDLAPSFPSSYYATIDAFGADLLAAANAAIIAGPFDYTVTYYSTSDPTPSLQGKFVICSSITGDAYNGIPVNFQVHTDFFYEFSNFLTIPTYPTFSTDAADAQKTLGVAPIYMGYNILSDTIIGSGNQTHAVGLFSDIAQTTVAAGWDALGAQAPLAVAYNETLGRIYIGDGSAGAVRIFDTNYNFLSTEGTAGTGFFTPSGTAFKMCLTSQDYLYICGRNENSVTKWQVDTLLTQNSPSVQTWAITRPFAIKENPGVPGEIWLIEDGSSGGSTSNLHKISPGGVLTTYTLTYTTGGFIPQGLSFVYDGTVWEIWLTGYNSATANIQIVDNIASPATPTTAITTGNVTIRDIIQHSTNGYVYVPRYGASVGDDTCLIISPTTRSTLITNVLAQTGQDPYAVIERTSDGKVFVGCSGDLTPPDGESAMIVVDYISENVNLNSAFSGGEDEVTEEIPPVIVEEDDGTNCLTQEEAYIIIENIKKICGCCCEFEDDILQKDISSTQ